MPRSWHGRVSDVSRWLAFLLTLAAPCFHGCSGGESSPETLNPCSDSWYQSVEESVRTADSQQHGPDVGSEEWKAAIEFQLGIRGKPGVPSRDSEAWCRHIDRMIENSP
jgi:hypothetical protein